MTTKSRKKRIVIWGAGGHGHVVADILLRLDDWQIAGFVDNVHAKGELVMGFPVLGDRGVLPALRADGVEALAVAIGDPAAHEELMGAADHLGFEQPALVHPFVSISSCARVGEGCVVCAGAIVGPQTDIRPGAILNSRASLDHDVVVGRCTHVAPGAIVCGYTSIGEGCWIGTGAVIRDHISIGNRTIIGAGATVLKDIPGGVTAYGIPAKIVERKA
ncbi:MAG: acetyltransferase [Kiritimatiellae bacterium]|nr:acetyltransferase [Kiritimatiellia bacterium]